MKLIMHAKRRFGGLLALFVITAVLIGVAPALAEDLVVTHSAPHWKVYDRTAKGAFQVRKPDPISGGGLEFALLNVAGGDYTPYLLTNYHGDLTGKTLVVTVGLVASFDAVFTYRIRPGGGCSGALLPSVRLEFQRTTAGAWVPTDYWWSNGTGLWIDLATLSTLPDFTITVPMDPARWSDIYGEWGTDQPDAFAEALKEVKQIGLSFGGGSCFANGVGLTAGAAIFKLMKYEITP